MSDLTCLAVGVLITVAFKSIKQKSFTLTSNTCVKYLSVNTLASAWVVSEVKIHHMSYQWIIHQPEYVSMWTNGGQTYINIICINTEEWHVRWLRYTPPSLHYFRMLALALQMFSVHQINRSELSIMSLPSGYSWTDQQIDRLINFHHCDLNNREAAAASRGAVAFINYKKDNKWLASIASLATLTWTFLDQLNCQ